MSGPILAKDIMVSRLITVSPDLGLREAARLLLKNKISGAPVVDEQGQLIGVFSEKDLMTALIDAVYDELPSSEVSAYMSRRRIHGHGGHRHTGDRTDLQDQGLPQTPRRAGRQAGGANQPP